MKVKQGLMLLLTILIGGAAAAGAAAAYYWHQATALPTWYTNSSSDGELATSLSSGSTLLQTKLAAGDDVEHLDNRQVEITLSESELNQLIQAGLAQTPNSSPLLQTAQGVKATIDGDRLQAGLVVNPASLPIQNLPAEAQQTLRQALETLPRLGDQDLYVGITGNPRVENGRLVLGADTRLQVGNVQLSMAEVARLTGLSPAQLNEQLNIALPQAGVTLDGLEFVDGEAILRGRRE
jgi:hypothetical protein